MNKFDIPGILYRTTLPDVGSRMTTPRPGKPLPIDCMLEGFMLDRKMHHKPDSDYSLVSQVPNLLTLNPDALVFTAFSAIPVADTFRGLYEALSVQCPRIAMIRASNRAQEDYDNDPALIETEVNRLGKALSGANEVTVIDQMSITGRTCELSRNLLALAGFKASYAIMGDWYHDAHKSFVDPEAVTSDYAPEMRSIGHSVGETILAST